MFGSGGRVARRYRGPRFYAKLRFSAIAWREGDSCSRDREVFANCYKRSMSRIVAFKTLPLAFRGKRAVRRPTVSGTL